MVNIIIVIEIELLELGKNKDLLVEYSTSVDETISKFKEFWDFILMDHQHVLNNLDKNIPNFKSLFSKLDANEKQRFKPILQIVAHSLQFLKKIISLDESYNLISKTNQTFDMISENGKGTVEILEKQLSIMQDECGKLREKEATWKEKVFEMEKEMKQLDEVEEIKKDKMMLGEELDEVKERFKGLVAESKEYKSQVQIQSNQLQDNQKLIEGMNKKIMNYIETEAQLDDMKVKNSKLYHQIEQKEHELEMTVADFKNIQEALSEIQEPQKAQPEKKTGF